MSSTIDTQATVVLAVTGMTCGSCQRHVREALAALPGVVEAGVDLVAGRATVVYDPDAVSLARMISAVEEAGYQAAITPAAGTANPLPVVQGGSCCAR